MGLKKDICAAMNVWLEDKENISSLEVLDYNEEIYYEEEVGEYSASSSFIVEFYYLDLGGSKMSWSKDFAGSYYMSFSEFLNKVIEYSESKGK